MIGPTERTAHAMYQFHIQIPNDLWERFKDRAIREHGSPRQATLFLLRQYISAPEQARQEGLPHATDDDDRPPE